MATDETKINLLLDFYGVALSEKQRDAVTMYYSSDMTLTEIADELGTSKQAASDNIKRGVAELLRLDGALKLLDRFSEAKKCIENIEKECCENDTIKKNLEKLAERYSDDLSNIHPEIRDDVLDAKLRVDETMFDEYLKKYQETCDPELKAELRYSLSLTRSDENIDMLVNLLGSPEIIKPQDHLYMFIYTMRNYKASEKALDWLFDNWEYVEKMTGEKSLEDYPRYVANTIKTREMADKFYAFFEQYKENPVLTRTLTVAKNEIEARIELIKNDRDDVFVKLDSFAV